MQENALHGWTLPEGKHMRMAGYPAKTEVARLHPLRPLAGHGGRGIRSCSGRFSAAGRWARRRWNSAPETASSSASPPHPEHEVVAAGFDTGLVIIADVQKEQILPVCGPGRGAVTALDWDAFGRAPRHRHRDRFRGHREFCPLDRKKAAAFWKKRRKNFYAGPWAVGTRPGASITKFFASFFKKRPFSSNGR